MIVSENFARESWGSASAAVGKRLRQFTNTPWQEVIGVVEDVRVAWRRSKKRLPSSIGRRCCNDPYTPKPTIDAPRFVTFAIRSTRAGTAKLPQQVQQAVWSVNASLPLAVGEHHAGDLRASRWRAPHSRWSCWRLPAQWRLRFGLIGIYGVISYAVSQRTREIGIRLALGAQKGALRWMFVRSALVLTGVGIVIGLGAAAALVQTHEDAALRHQPTRSPDFPRGAAHAGHRGCACKLSAGSPRCRSRSS